MHISVSFIYFLVFFCSSMNSFKFHTNFVKKRRSMNHPLRSLNANRQSSFLSKFDARFIAAPMVSFSDLAFRLLVQRHGCDLCFTQMIHARDFARSSKLRKLYFDPMVVGSSLNSGCATSDSDRPLIVQLAGDDAKDLVNAARYVENECDAVDLNLGCPQKIAKKGHYGAYLLNEPDTVQRIVETMVDQLSVPVTVKIRLLEQGLDETIKFAKMLESAGASMVTVHGRTVKQNKQFCGSANKQAIRAVKQELSIPVVANGGVENAFDVMELMQYTGCDGVMSSEALLENPALFEPEEIWRAESSLKEDDNCDTSNIRDQSVSSDSFSNQLIAAKQMSFVFEYLELAKQFPPTQGEGVIKGHIFKMAHRLLTIHTDLRTQLASKAFTADQIYAVMKTLEERYDLSRHVITCSVIPQSEKDRKSMSSGFFRYDSSQLLNDCEKGTVKEEYPVGNLSWYRRHRGNEK